MPAPYPIFLKLEHSTCLVVGAGSVGRRKIEGLIKAGAKAILVVDPAASIDPLLSHPAVTLAARPFAEPDLEGKNLVFAATDDAGLNESIARACGATGILCNVATSKDLSDFLVPSSLSLQKLHLAISTDGASPAVSRRLRLELEQYLAPFSVLADLMGRLRPLVLHCGQSSEENAEIFRSVVDSDIVDALREHDAARIEATLARLLPEVLHARITELTHDLF